MKAIGPILLVGLAMAAFGFEANSQDRKRSRSEDLAEQIKQGSALTLQEHTSAEEVRAQRVQERFDEIDARLASVVDRLEQIARELSQREGSPKRRK